MAKITVREWILFDTKTRINSTSTATLRKENSCKGQ